MEIVSIREFARRVKVSDTAIRKAIKEGRITEKCVRTNERNGRPELFAALALKDWNQAGGGLVKELDENAGKKKADLPPPETNQKPGELSTAEAKRRSEVYKMQMLGLDLAERQKILVNRRIVYDSLFNFGIQIRSSMEAIPDKYLDQILAAPDRTEANVILSKAINEALEALSKTDEIKI